MDPGFPYSVVDIVDGVLSSKMMIGKNGSSELSLVLTFKCWPLRLA